MAISAKFPFIFIIVIFTILLHIITISSDSDTDLVNELITLQSRSKSGLIHLDDSSVRHFLTNTKLPRPFSLLIFFDAAHLHEKSELHLKDLKSEFTLLASSFITNHKDTVFSGSNRIFFCDIEFKDSQQSFGLFGVNSLPHIRFVGNDVGNLKDSDQMDQGDFSRLAESMSDFVESKIRLKVGVIHRPPMFSKKQLGLFALVLAMLAPFAIKKVIAGETLLHDSKLWLSGAVFIYFFSVSGAMHNIIRKMPMFMADRNDPSKLVFFYQGSGMQLGAEGFAVGSLYTIVGVLLALMTHLFVKIRNVTAQRVIMVFALIVSFWAVKKVIYLDNWKTGYGIHAYWPSSWK